MKFDSIVSIALTSCLREARQQNRAKQPLPQCAYVLDPCRSVHACTRRPGLRARVAQASSWPSPCMQGSALTSPSLPRASAPGLLAHACVTKWTAMVSGLFLYTNATTSNGSPLHALKMVWYSDCVVLTASNHKAVTVVSKSVVEQCLWL